MDEHLSPVSRPPSCSSTICLLVRCTPSHRVHGCIPASPHASTTTSDPAATQQCPSSTQASAGFRNPGSIVALGSVTLTTTLAISASLNNLAIVPLLIIKGRTSLTSISSTYLHACTATSAYRHVFMRTFRRLRVRTCIYVTTRTVYISHAMCLESP